MGNPFENFTIMQHIEKKLWDRAYLKIFMVFFFNTFGTSNENFDFKKHFKYRRFLLLETLLVYFLSYLLNGKGKFQ